MTRMQLIFKLEKAWLNRLSLKENRQAEVLHFVLEALEAEDFRRAIRICELRNTPPGLVDTIREVQRASWKKNEKSN